MLRDGVVSSAVRQYISGQSSLDSLDEVLARIDFGDVDPGDEENLANSVELDLFEYQSGAFGTDQLRQRLAWRIGEAIPPPRVLILRATPSSQAGPVAVIRRFVPRSPITAPVFVHYRRSLTSVSAQVAPVELVAHGR